MMMTFGNVYASERTAQSYCVINAVTGEVVFEKNCNKKMPMASTTKIITLITAIENSTPEEIVTVREEAICFEGSSAYLKPRAKIKMNNLLYGLALNSGNDAAAAVAYHISGSIENFAKLMNDTVSRIGVKNTHLKNPSGLESEGHYTTAYDLAKITAYGLKNEYFGKIVSSKVYDSRMILEDGNIEDIQYVNHNRLLREIDGCVGVKTGYTKAAGRCLVSSVSRDGSEYVIVTLNDSDDWNTHKILCEKAFEGQKHKIIIKKGDVLKKIVSGNEECILAAADDFSVYTTEGGGKEFDIEICLPNDVDFPLNKGEKVGCVQIRHENSVIGVVDIISEKDFYARDKTKIKDNFFFVLKTILRNNLQ